MEKKMTVWCHYKREWVAEYSCPDGCCTGGGYWWEGYGMAQNAGKVNWYGREWARLRAQEMKAAAVKLGVEIKFVKVGTWT